MVGKTALVSGHSEGGVASILAANKAALDNDYTCDFTAILVLSGCFQNPVDESLIREAVKSNKIPIFWITGTEDW